MFIIVENMGRLNFGNDIMDTKVCLSLYVKSITKNIKFLMFVFILGNHIECYLGWKNIKKLGDVFDS